MDALLLAAVGGAFVTGLTGSVHCLMMCGPLACAAVPRGTTGGGPGAVRTATLAYQGARIASYAAVGGLLGALGGGVALALSVSIRPYLPWVMAAALLASVFQLGKRLRPLPGLSKLIAAITRAGAKFSVGVRAGVIGGVTPLLPCGLLYGVFAAALSSSSAAAGMAVMGAFALGALPALVAAQLGLSRVNFQNRWLDFTLRRAVPLAAAFTLMYRSLTVTSSCH